MLKMKNDAIIKMAVQYRGVRCRRYAVAFKGMTAALLLAAASLHAQTIGEKSGINAMLDRAPVAADVLLELHQFDLFEQGVTDSAGSRGDDAIRKYATTRSDDADKRDKQLSALQKKSGVKAEFPDQPDASRSNRLAGLSGSVGPAYVKGFYQAQVAEQDSIVSLLTRYLAKPDNDTVQKYAAEQMPVFTKGLQTARQALDAVAN